MPLRLRRGTNAERQLITPLEGELIYATDTKEVWIGDGTTQGGILITGDIPNSVGDLDDVDTTSNLPQAGDVLKWDSSSGKFIPQPDIDTTLIFESISDLPDVDIITNPPLEGQTLIWNGSSFVPSYEPIVADILGSVFSDDSTPIIDGVNGTITSAGFIQFGSYTTTERDELSPLNGMVLYNTTANRFQGYQNNTWINLDDGTAA